MTMIKGIQIEVIDDDPDYLKLRISATNGEFAGVADVYVSPEGALELATKLDSFPRSPLDTREVFWGHSAGHKRAGRRKFVCSALIVAAPAGSKSKLSQAWRLLGVCKRLSLLFQWKLLGSTSFCLSCEH